MGVMVWSGIGTEHPDLHVIKNDTLTVKRYLDKILQPIFFLYAAAVGNRFIFLLTIILVLDLKK